MNYQMLVVTCLLVAIQLTSPVTADEECCEEYCYGSDRERPQTRQYSTKTAYEVIRGIDYGKLYQAHSKCGITLYCPPVRFKSLSKNS